MNSHDLVRVCRFLARLRHFLFAVRCGMSQDAWAAPMLLQFLGDASWSLHRIGPTAKKQPLGRMKLVPLMRGDG